MTRNPLTVNVMLWGTWIGRLSWDADKQLSVFQFTEDFVENPKEKIETVINAVAKFGQWCDHYNVDAGTKKLIQNALDFIRPR